MAEVQSVETVAKMLAHEHVSDDPNITEIYWARHPKEVRLVEITSSVSDKGEVLPFRFTEDPPDVPFQSVVVLLSPADWQDREKLRWPDGFADSDMERVFARAG
jgi:hypothetical protein